MSYADMFTPFDKSYLKEIGFAEEVSDVVYSKFNNKLGRKVYIQKKENFHYEVSWNGKIQKTYEFVEDVDELF
jgi:hypothetical protein